MKYFAMHYLFFARQMCPYAHVHEAVDCFGPVVGHEWLAFRRASADKQDPNWRQNIDIKHSNPQQAAFLSALYLNIAAVRESLNN